MQQLTEAFRKELLFGKHKAILTSQSNSVELNTIGKKVKALHGGNQVEATYDGYDFSIASLSGGVFVNNQPAAVGQILTGAHVITLGVGRNRRFVTFDVSHPEVEL